jgi:RND family efflux transporter MFP subunit
MAPLAIAQLGEEYTGGNLPGLQSNVVRAQLVPLQKAVFSGGITAIVEEVHVNEGEFVKKGARLLTFDCDAIEASRQVAQARVESSEATLQVNIELVKLNSVGPLEVKLNQADLEAARGELDAVQAKIKHCDIRAPFDGAITMRAVDQHQFVAEGERMLELVSRDALEARMLMPSTSLSWLRVGSDFIMLIEEIDTSMKGEIVRIGGAVDPVSLTIPVFGRLDAEDERLLPGMSGRVQFRNLDLD